MMNVLQVLASQPRDNTGEAWVSGKELREATGLQPAEINDVVDLLTMRGLVEWQQVYGTAPYNFHIVTITGRGRFEFAVNARRLGLYDTTREEHPSQRVISERPLLHRTPVGSPFGFTEQDWQIIVSRSNLSELRVVLGCQFDSNHYDREKLKANIEEMFQKAVDDYKNQPRAIKVTLNFQPLEAGYGEHLFNEIARDIISADIAVFETSDLNSNVLIEMGVALTHGVMVFPIKKEGCEKPPSDISGQTWADYRNSGEEFLDRNHHRKLVSMIDRAIRKKRAH